MAWDDEDDDERAFWESEDARAQAEADAAGNAERDEAAGYVQCVHGNVRVFCEQCEQERQ